MFLCTTYMYLNGVEKVVEMEKKVEEEMSFYKTNPSTHPMWNWMLECEMG